VDKRVFHKTLTILIAGVWLINGLICKLLNLVPRHQRIVARILGSEYAGNLTKAIGLAEIAMAIWILSSIKSRINTIAQIAVVASMNIIEFILAPDLLLWGKANSLFAILFIILIYYNEFDLNKRSVQHS
jgi:hypothetical protein